jgi:hypothetical protein
LNFRLCNPTLVPICNRYLFVKQKTYKQACSVL